jgi:NAD(P)-dependent dehydrogenase (short-subunit alcohol dehydrogenase family)
MLVDVTDSDALGEAVRQAWLTLEGIDVLLNNAGYGLVGCLEELSDFEIQRIMDTNFGGTLASIRAAIPLMREKGGGDIVNLTSLMGLIGAPGLSVYCATKFAIEGLTDALAHELAPFGIRVMAIAAGAFRTNFSGGSVVSSRKQIPAYAKNPGRQTGQLISNMSGSESGDPRKLAAVLVEMLDGPELPVHLVCGGDAYKSARNRFNQSLVNLDQWERFGTSTDFQSEI